MRDGLAINIRESIFRNKDFTSNKEDSFLMVGSRNNYIKVYAHKKELWNKTFRISNKNGQFRKYRHIN